jgi:hypothetical protein
MILFGLWTIENWTCGGSSESFDHDLRGNPPLKPFRIQINRRMREWRRLSLCMMGGQRGFVVSDRGKINRLSRVFHNEQLCQLLGLAECLKNHLLEKWIDFNTNWQWRCYGCTGQTVLYYTKIGTMDFPKSFMMKCCVHCWGSLNTSQIICWKDGYISILQGWRCCQLTEYMVMCYTKNGIADFWNLPWWTVVSIAGSLNACRFFAGEKYPFWY